MGYIDEMKKYREVYNSQQSSYRCAVLPETDMQLGNAETRLLVRESRVELYVFNNGLWSLRARNFLPEESSVTKSKDTLTIEAPGLRERITACVSDTEPKIYFSCDITHTNLSEASEDYSAEYTSQYFAEGPLPEFTYASYKWIARGKCLEEYIRPELKKDFLGNGCNNQLFYEYSGGTYLGIAHVDLSRNWLSLPGREHYCWLRHSFMLDEAVSLKQGESFSFSILLFAGTGPEESVGMLSDFLWEMNAAEIHVPQTDMRTYLDQYYSVWKKAELTGYAPADHYAAHFFADFYGNYKEGHYTDDQFGCSWLSYDLLKADYFLRLHERTKDPEYLERAKNIVNFYCYHHYVGNTKLTYSFHTAEFMKTCPPYPAVTGWGAPLDAGYLDSLAQSEMIYDALVLYEKHPEIFKSEYPLDIADDVLRMQQADGHFCRRYDDKLKPQVKPGWIDQTYESQTWIPTLIKLYELTGRQDCMAAALKCGQAAAFDLERKGLFAMGGCETDYPTYWDIDGFRSMLRAMLSLYEATGDEVWLKNAEKSQQLSSCMEMGYVHPIPEDTFYDSIGWKTTGMIATSYYGEADYLRSFCTPSGNQTVVWVAYLLLKLYRYTGKAIYAKRAVAGMRQVMVFRNEESLAGKHYKDNLLYTIFENNPQIDDPSGNYKAGVAQDGYSMFIDVYIFLDDILEDFGGIYIDDGRRHIFGIDCVKVENADFEKRSAVIRNELAKDRSVLIHMAGNNAEEDCTKEVFMKSNETVTINW